VLVKRRREAQPSLALGTAIGRERVAFCGKYDARILACKTRH
jgi:hypothetical protein